MKYRLSSRAIGLLMLAAFPLYGVGQLLYSRGSYVGTILILLNSMAVVTIGILFYPMVKMFNEHTALGYLSTRILEGVFLGVGALLPASNDLSYLMGMSVLGIGSLFLCFTLINSASIPKWLGLWGGIGYISLSIGSAADISGLGLGSYFLIPGGLFELFFALWMIVKGINLRSNSNVCFLPGEKAVEEDPESLLPHENASF